jgi:hypothetical protein
MHSHLSTLFKLIPLELCIASQQQASSSYSSPPPAALPGRGEASFIVLFAEPTLEEEEEEAGSSRQGSSSTSYSRRTFGYFPDGRSRRWMQLRDEMGSYGGGGGSIKEEGDKVFCTWFRLCIHCTVRETLVI